MSIKKLKRFNHLDPYNNNLFTCFNYPSKDEEYIDRSFIKIASFDPGVINTGFRIERKGKNRRH